MALPLKLVPTYSLLRGGVTHEVVLMDTSEGHLRKYFVPFRHKLLNNAPVIPKGFVYHINVFGKPAVASLPYSQRPSKREILVQYRGYCVLVVSVPKYFVESPHLLFVHVCLLET